MSEDDTTVRVVSDMQIYQMEALSTFLLKDKEPAFMYLVLGLSSEAGELAGKVSKIVRDKENVASDEDVSEIAKELGDVLWFVACLAYEMGIPLTELAAENLKKLADRKARGVIGGSGDNR
jgi:NTP pyrophosphatase (non-canonical NTP hydrolase)